MLDFICTDSSEIFKRHHFASDHELEAVYAWLDAHLKAYFLMEYISMCIAGPSVSKSRGHHVEN
jgi:hypothetical protein